MKNLEIIISLSGTIAGLLVTTATFLIKFIKNKKAKKICEQVIKIGNSVIPYIEQAESFTHYSGEEKKKFVMTKANQYAIDNDFIFDEKLVSQKIEELVILTKKVNQRSKDYVSMQPYVPVAAETNI